MKHLNMIMVKKLKGDWKVILEIFEEIFEKICKNNWKKLEKFLKNFEEISGKMSNKF